MKFADFYFSDEYIFLFHFITALPSSPLRVHGALTSRNCVVDARWVLKITDYGLPAFYDVQGLSPPSKSAKGKCLHSSSAKKEPLRIMMHAVGSPTSAEFIYCSGRTKIYQVESFFS